MMIGEHVLKWPPGREGSSKMALGLTLLWVGVYISGFAQIPFSFSEYRNQTYVPGPDPIPDVSDPQPSSFAVFGGHVSNFDTPGSSTTPTDGTFYLTRSAFAQPVDGSPHLGPDFKFGEEIIPDPALMADLEYSPFIDPPQKAYYVPETDGDAGRVYAGEAGFVRITWRDEDGNIILPAVQYLISNIPVREPVAIYHTHKPSDNLTESGPTNRAPAIDLSEIQDVIIHWNTAIPDNSPSMPPNPFLLLAPGDMLYAKEKTGLVTMEYRGSGNSFLGIEVVSLRPIDPPDGETHVDIGDELLPDMTVENPSKPLVTKGLDGEVNGVAYQHNVPDATQEGDVFAIRATESNDDIEIYWTKEGLEGVVWPYELHFYTAAWPTNPDKFQLYARGSSPLNLGPVVHIPSEQHPRLMPFQEPAAHASLEVTTFSSDQAGWSLLQYQTGDDPVGIFSVGFQVVKSVLHNDVAEFDLSLIPWDIGTSITEVTHEGPRAGHIYVKPGLDPLEDRYDWEVYDGNPEDPEEWDTDQIYGVNLGRLEVWWSNLNQGVQWPSLVKRYNNTWPSNPEKIIIASQMGTGDFNPADFQDLRFYFQNDPEAPGFNPNDEHAMVRPFAGGEAVFALRDDLGTAQTSLPYVLVKYRDPHDDLLWKYQVFQVVAEESPYFFEYPGTAATVVQPIFPISSLPLCQENFGVSGPFWKDRKGTHWARAAGDNGGTAEIVMRFFYTAQIGFYFPGPRNDRTGDCVPLLDLRAGTPGVPIDIAYDIAWPEDLPELRVGETLVLPKVGLPAIRGQCGVEVIYQQSVANGGGESVQLIDPTRVIQVDLAAAPDDVATQNVKGELLFPDLPPHIRSRLSYDPINLKLKFKGLFIEPPAGEAYLLPNIITKREEDILKDPEIMGTNANFQSAINNLVNQANSAIIVDPMDIDFDSLALTAGFAAGEGFVTLAFQNQETLCDPALPVSLEVIRVTCPLNRGEIKVITADCPFDEKLTLRHSGDFAGESDEYLFEWRTLPAVGGTFPDDPPDDWSLFPTMPGTGLGSVDITIGGPSLFTLSDNWFICRYRPAPTGNQTCGAMNWSDWTMPQLAEGWIKRVLAGINPYEQRFSDLGDPARTVNTVVNMISQSGTRWQGSVPLNCDVVDDFGLIEIYETVLKRGIQLSIEGTPSINYPPANDALLLVAGRLADLYALLGNEAFSDAADPTIGFGLNPSEAFLAASSSIHAFMNQTSGLLEEELALLRGRDDFFAPGVEIPPFHNRIVWNFSGGFGEVAYALNYDIRDANSGEIDGSLDEADARQIYPQGHGDAWGHYLAGIKNYYRLIRNDNFTWVPRAEAVLIGGVPVTVDFLDERKFARVAAAKARTGTEIVNLTYRQNYTEDPNGQWQGYKDDRMSPKSFSIPDEEPRSWGLSEWGSRVGQGAFVDWVVGNAILSPTSQGVGIQKVDRTTVVELREVAETLQRVQAEMDKADTGVNPLGLSKNIVPFDIDPSKIDDGETHFEQIYTRAVRALNNAITVFNNANNSTQQLRRQADALSDFQKNVRDREADFNNRLIELFGTPYPEDIGGAGAYPSGYHGPDIYHYMYVEQSALVGKDPGPLEVFHVKQITTDVDPGGGIFQSDNEIEFHLSTIGFGLVKPGAWTSQRTSPGEIQMARSNIILAKARFEQVLVEYDNLLRDIQDAADLIKARHNLASDEIRILDMGLNTQQTLKDKIIADRARQLDYQNQAETAVDVANAIAEALPKFFVVGFSSGTDFTSIARGAIRKAGALLGEVLMRNAENASVAELDHSLSMGLAQAQTNIELTTIKTNFEIEQQVSQLRQLVRQEASLRLEIYALQESMQQTASQYLATLARGHRLLEERLRFRKDTAANIQELRYKDMAFRIFRNDALQKYRAQFDLAALYVYLTARAYDYETNLLNTDSRSGQDFLTEIIRSRAIGLIQNGNPQTGTGQGDAGLADPMARMNLNWDLVLEGQLGFNNPNPQNNEFSLRRELFRIQPSGAQIWRETLDRHLVDNIFDIPEFRRLAVPFSPALPVEPALVIPFETNINAGLNFFGWPAGGNDSTFNSSFFAVKLRSVGVFFSNYDNQALLNTPNVYLIPVGTDILRVPGGSGEIREWKIVDQRIPVPFPIGGADLNDPEWSPLQDSLSAPFAEVRRFSSFQACHDGGNCEQSEVTANSRLIGRSAWNTKWLLIIPAVELGSNREEALDTFIHGREINGQRTGNGVADIRLKFNTYGYSGN